MHSIGPPESVLHNLEEFMPSETESIGEEPARAPVTPELGQEDNVSRNSLEDEVGAPRKLDRHLFLTTILAKRFALRATSSRGPFSFHGPFFATMTNPKANSD